MSDSGLPDYLKRRPAAPVPAVAPSPAKTSPTPPVPALPPVAPVGPPVEQHAQRPWLVPELTRQDAPRYVAAVLCGLLLVLLAVGIRDRSSDTRFAARVGAARLGMTAAELTAALGRSPMASATSATRVCYAFRDRVLLPGVYLQSGRLTLAPPPPPVCFNLDSNIVMSTP